MVNINDVMDILEDECLKEIQCVLRTRELMAKTRNPFRRIALKSHCKIFMEHSIAIDRAIRRIRRELES